MRTEADELTYDLHVLVRFELERAIFTGGLDLADLPEAWNERMREYLDVDVPSDTAGVLQDVHWAEGLFGYFPTYSLGNIIAGQLWEAAHEALPDLEQHIEHGDLAPLREWLREHVHRHGRKLEPAEMVERATGRPIEIGPYVRYLSEKYGDDLRARGRQRRPPWHTPVGFAGMPRAQTNGIELEYEAFGDPSNPTMLLIMGLGVQMLGWDERFCNMLADRGFHVVRFDNRDIGLSTKIEGGPPPNPLELMAGNFSSASYTLDDMADDTAGLLDALDVDAAHVVGVSMGGMIGADARVPAPGAGAVVDVDHVLDRQPGDRAAEARGLCRADHANTERPRGVRRRGDKPVQAHRLARLPAR